MIPANCMSRSAIRVMQESTRHDSYMDPERGVYWYYANGRRVWRSTEYPEMQPYYRWNEGKR